MVELTLIQIIAIAALPLLFAITLHEVAHGFVASLCGDQTARLAGRLSTNPIKHIDPIGTILLPGIMLALGGVMFGWAKPVPVDYRNLRHPRRDAALVALAGPTANILMALAWGILAKLAMRFLPATSSVVTPLAYMGEMGISINVALAVINLIPLPPLDGARIVESLLPRRYAYYYNRLEPYGFIILFALLYFGLLTALLGPLILGTSVLLSSLIDTLF